MKNHYKNSRYLCTILLMAWLLTSCSRKTIETPQEAMRRVTIEASADDLGATSLIDGLKQMIEVGAKRTPEEELIFGPLRISRLVYLRGLRELLDVAEKSRDIQAILTYLNAHFDAYEVYGDKRWGQVFMTSYFEPVISGSRTQTEKYSQALYAKPADILNLDLAQFDSRFEKERKMRARLEGQKILPYFSRAEIDIEHKLSGRQLELCWVDPVEAFFLQIQGSGTVTLDDGTSLKLGYAEKNGHPYKALGAQIKDKFPGQKITLQLIKSYLATLSMEKKLELMSTNPSYVFFQIATQNALTSYGTPAVAGRTIATDKRFFPKGALGLLTFPKPIFDSPQASTPARYEEVSRLVFDVDIGGAITGPARVDLFWGRGAEAEQAAGGLQGDGRLVYFVPRMAAAQ